MFEVKVLRFTYCGPLLRNGHNDQSMTNPGGGIATRHEHPPINGGEEGTDCAQDDDDTDASDNKRRLRKRGC